MPPPALRALLITFKALLNSFFSVGVHVLPKWIRDEGEAIIRLLSCCGKTFVTDGMEEEINIYKP